MLKENRCRSTSRAPPEPGRAHHRQHPVQTFDLGGHETARRLWKDYFTTVDGVVYMVDGFDRGRFPRPARARLPAHLRRALAAVPFLVLGNKIDAHSAASEDDLRYALGLFETLGDTGAATRQTTTKSGPSSSSCSVIRKMGYADGFRWLAQFF
ncbi:hypothetical protein JL721_12679 [Aureococcus anophagefferens]|nr:hypothetical protein JL721_12679 [Aureococcus anophagefferens]